MEDVNANQTTSFSILDIKVSDQSDEALQQMHDDIKEDVARFLDHVGFDIGCTFIADLASEMKDRKMDCDLRGTPPDPPRREIGTYSGRSIFVHTPTTPKPGATPRNRKQRRAQKSKARHG